MPTVVKILVRKTLKITILIFTTIFFTACHVPNTATPLTTTTTRIAKTNIIGLHRIPAKYCSTHYSYLSTHSDSIAVTDPAFLDDLCVLGYSSHVIAAPKPIPQYLSTLYPQIDRDNTSVEAADIILTDDIYPLSNPHAIHIHWSNWKERLKNLAHYLHRQHSVDKILTSYKSYAKKTYKKYETSSTEISLISVDDQNIMLEGRNSFSSDVLNDIGAHRPDRINFGAPKKLSSDYSGAESDLVYITFTPDGEKNAKSMLESLQWSKLEVAKAHRQFIVNYSWWHDGLGLIAARCIIDDIRDSIYKNS